MVRRFRLRLPVGFLLLWLTALPSFGQGFGRNKVNWTLQEWKTIRSEHFDLYFPDGAEWLAEFAATTAEDALAQIEDDWNYELENRIPIILYTSHNTFSETNVIGGLIGEGTGGFTEFNRNRVVIPYEGSYAQLRHVIHHELVHALEYDMFMNGNFRSLALNRLVSLPLWVVEGLAEFESMGWDIEADNVMRDATISDYVPPIDSMGYGVFAYKGGQSLYRYLSQKYGREKIGDFLRSLKHSANVEKAFEAIYGLKMDELDEDWKRWLKREYWPEIAERLAPSEFAEPLTDHTEDGSYLNVGGALSPDGKRVAYVSTARGFADVYLMEIASKKTTRIVEGEQSPDFESLFLLRPGLAWSPDGNTLAIMAKKNGKNVLFLFDLDEREVDQEFVFDLDAMFTPTWSPDGKAIVVVGLKDGWSDLYRIDIPDGTLTRLTRDPYDERDPDWSPDGRRLVFASDRPAPTLAFDSEAPFHYGNYDLFLFDLSTRTLEQVTFHRARDLYPVWGPKGKEILFVSERSGIGNLYLLNVADRSVRPVTDSLTGCQQIDWSADGSRVVFTAFQEGGYDLFVMDDPRRIERTSLPPLTELGKRLFAPREEPASLEAPPETAAVPPESEAPKGSESPISGGFVARIPDLASILSAVPENATNETTPKERSPAGTAAKPADENNAPAEEQEAPDTRTIRRKTTRPQTYRPRLKVESFGVNTQVNSYLGFTGQAYLRMSDLLGNERFTVVTDQSISSLKNLNAIVSYVYLRDRLDYGITAFHTRAFFLANEGRVAYDHVVMVADRNVGFQGIAEYPFSQFSRVEMGAGFQWIGRDRVGIRVYEYDRVGAFGNIVREVQEEPIDRKSMIPLELAYVKDTVGYGMFGPADGERVRFGVLLAPGTSARYLRFGTVSADYRTYFRLGDSQNLAFRFSAGHSFGPNAQRFFLGGVPTEISPRISRSVDEKLRAEEIFFPSFQGPLRGSDLYEFVGDTFLLTNLEWRFTLIDKLAIGWPLPITFRRIGGILFADAGRAFDLEAPAEEATSRVESIRDLVAGIGFGTRVHLGIFILRLDAAWRATAEGITSSPRYYWSLGADF